MRFASAVVAASAAVVASAQQTSYEGYISEVCMPLNSTGYPDLNAPCNAVAALQAECIYGPGPGLAFANSQYGAAAAASSTAVPEVPAEQSNRTQQVCVCESQFFALLAGCTACERAHGSGDLVAFFNDGYIATLSSSYCAATATPTVDFANFLNDYADPTSLAASLRSAVSAARTSSFSDPVGNRTAVSLYFTPSVTGSAAWLVAEPTGASGPGTFATVATLNGQIVATASANPSTASTGTSSGAGTRETAAVVGVVGLMGLVALL